MAADDRVAAAAKPPAGERQIRAAEVVGALSLATDLGTGQPLEHALRTAILAVRLGELAEASVEELADTYYVALLHASGCTSNGHEAAQLYGDDIAHRAAFFLIDPTNPAEVLAFYRAYVGAGRPPEVREAILEDAIANAGPRARDSFAAMCEVAQRFAGGSTSGPASKEHSSTSSRAGTGGDFRTRAATRSRCRCACCTWRGMSPCSSLRPAPTKRARSSSSERAPRMSLGCQARPAQLRRPTGRARRDADLGAGAGGGAVSRALDRGRANRCCVHRDRRAHRSQIAVAA